MGPILGINLWHGAWLAAPPPLGDRTRLARELDDLKSHGVRWVRIFACSEGPSHPRRVPRTLQPRPGIYDEVLLAGLDHLLEALGDRGMQAILVLSNFWDWSGGLGQYRAWCGAPPVPDPAIDGWTRLQRYVAAFYRDDAARGLFDRHVVAMVQRYRDAPALGLWQIANEPRGVGDGPGMRRWIAHVAGAVAAADPNHPVSVGSEGSTAHPHDAGLSFAEDHADPAISVTTCHVWLENWGLYDPATADEADFQRAMAWGRDYVSRHARMAAQLDKPLLVEEFGLARDGGVRGAGTPTTRRDRFFADLSDHVDRLRREGLPVAGILPWTWSGEALAGPGGDPPHEPDGWYGIGSADHSTLEVLAASSLAS